MTIATEPMQAITPMSTRSRVPAKTKGHAISDTQILLALVGDEAEQAAVILKPFGAVPAFASNGDGAGEGHTSLGTHLNDADPSAITVIRELQAQRVATIRMQLRIDNQVGSLVRRAMGWRMDLPEKERATINKAAEELIEAIREGHSVTETHAQCANAVRPFVLASQTSRAGFDAHRAEVEKSMRQLARTLPAWPWAEAIRGFAELGLATIVGEAGDLSNYANPAKLWKRMGLAVFGGKSQRKVTGDAALEQGYSPRRRSCMWNVGDALIKSNGEGVYRTLYLARKAMEHERNPEMSKMHAHRRAQRYMEKRLLRDFWREWNKPQSNGQ